MRSKGCNALAVPNSKRGRNLQMDRASSKPPAKARGRDRKKTSNNTKMRSTGYLRKDKRGSGSYSAGICFDSLEMNARICDLKTALEDLVILTAVKQKMRNQICTGTFTERLQAALVSSSTEHGRSLPDLKLGFMVFQAAGCFIGSGLRTPSVRSLELFGKIRSVLEPFRQYAKNLGGQNVYWQFSPVHLEDAWERFQSAVAEAWRIAGVDSTATLQKIRSRYETRAPLRTGSLHLWERQHMATEDKNKHRRWRLREHNARWERWERQHMAMEDKNKHRPRKLRERNPTGPLERWERRQMAMCDKNKHRPKNLRERNPTGALERWERRQMAFEDKNKHQSYQSKRLRQNLQYCESNLSRQLTALRKLIARWGQMLKREAKLVDKERQKKLRERKAQQKKSQERRRVEVLNEKRLREKERSRREWLRKRMRSDLTMDEILGQKDGTRKTGVRRQTVNE